MSWSNPSHHGPVCHVMVQSIMSWSSPSNHGPVCHVMVQSIRSWSSLSCHGPVHHIMVQSFTSWSSLSSHGPVCHIMVQCITSWSSASRHGLARHIMVQCIMSWSSPSRHGPVHQELTLQHVLLVPGVDWELAPVVVVVVHTQPPLGFKDILPPAAHLLHLQLQNTGDPFIISMVGACCNTWHSCSKTGSHSFHGGSGTLGQSKTS